MYGDTHARTYTRTSMKYIQVYTIKIPIKI